MYTIVTHSGSFHADDVFAIAAFQLLLGVDQVHVIRTRDEAVIAEADYVVDVGGVYDHAAKRYDHHQLGAPVRENGIPYAGFGLVWKHYGEAVCDSKDIADYIEENITQPIDAGDNGVSLYDLKEYQIKPFELYNFVSLFSPPWGSDESKDDQFHQAVDWARGILKRMIMKGQGAQKQHTLIAQVYESSRDKRVLEFDVSISMMSVIQYPDVEVVVCPDDPQLNNKWTATCVRKDFNTFDSRVSFPAKWAGLSGQDLQEVSEIADAEFCHKARFIFVAQSKESAVLAAKLAE
jgi:uncharacterized UPF0160 family protein